MVEENGNKVVEHYYQNADKSRLQLISIYCIVMHSPVQNNDNK